MHKLTCKRCTYQWFPKQGSKPKVCPRCKSYYWENPPRPRAVKAAILLAGVLLAGSLAGCCLCPCRDVGQMQPVFKPPLDIERMQANNTECKQVQ